MQTTFRFLLALACCVAFASSAEARSRLFFRADLSDAENVDEFVSPTMAEGLLVIHRSFRGKLRYSLDVSNLPNAFAAHIHCAPMGMDGPPGVTLFMMEPDAAITLNGTIAHGPIMAPDRPEFGENFCGWLDLDDVLAALRSGDTYVNVHTLQNFPGEIRGQIH